MTEPYQLTAWQAGELLQKKEISARELTASVYSRIDAVESKVNAYQTLLREQAEQRADSIDQKRANGETLSPWAGVPIAIKDNFCMRGSPTTCSSKMLQEFVPPYDATVVAKMLDAGLIPIGKTN
ncbi:Asp-tRNA(Asn)/Glu-tRNA(Gln) amidotransferase subunit GatA, partial [bacterium]|nr:Asp-tRNA(Asn)/Glu-tRNA(Gln) amidotransferase subunit GatA [bacterium]